MAEENLRYIPDRTIAISGRIFSQCTGAGIDIYTNYVNSIMTSRFKLSVNGQRSLNNALNNLPVQFTSDEGLTFGWTPDHALRNRGVGEYVGGYEHVALEVALSEYFSESYAARVLQEMASSYAQKTDHVPNIRHWRELVHSSSGILASAGFGLLVGDYSRLNPYMYYDAANPNGLRSLPRPKRCAQVLELLAKITSGNEKQMTIFGGPVIGWFAATAEWLFGVRIAIYSSTGEKLHSHENHDTQILVVYTDTTGVDAQFESWQNDSEHAKQVGLRPSTQVGDIPRAQVGGRIIWNSLLPRFFGPSFRHLEHEENKTMATAIGCAARIFQGLAEGVSTKDIRTPYKATYGAGLVQTLSIWLPELGRSQGRIERQLKRSMEEAQQLYDEQLQALQYICDCNACGNPDNVDSKSKSGHCLLGIVETIIALALTLANTAITSPIYPTRPGVQSFYLRQVANRQAARQTEGSNLKQFETIYSTVWNVTDAVRLQNCSEVLAGTRPTDRIPANTVGISHEGICVYLAKLEHSSTRPDDGLVRVVSGGINVREKVYRRACLGPVEGADDIDNVWEQENCEHLSQPLYCV